MDDVEVIFEGWLWRLTEGKRKRLLGNPWKRQYVLLKRVEMEVSLDVYDKQPKSVNEKTKDTVLLNGPHLVEKRYDFKGKQYVCNVVTSTRRISLAPEDEKTLHLLAFFIQTHTKLHMKLAAECYVVRPEGTEDQRKIGARGSMCLLHVSPWGLTLALQLSHAVLAQWPVAHIKCYESTEQGLFSFEAGRKAAMGTGKYAFCTRRGQDNEIYDRLDHYIMSASTRVQSQPGGDSEFSVARQIEQLHTLTWVFPDPAFSTHLKKVSREIYDQLWQQLDCSRPVHVPGSTSVMDSPHSSNTDRPRFENQLSVDTLPSSLKKKSRSDRSLTSHGSPAYMNDPNNTSGSRRKTSAAVNIKDTTDGASASGRHRTTSKNSNSTISVDSQYLHVASPTTPSSPTSINSVLSAFASPVKKAPEFKPVPELPEYLGMQGRVQSGEVAHGQTRPGQIALQFPDNDEDYLEPSSTVPRREARSEHRKLLRAKIKSQSCEDLSEYMKMSLTIPRQAHVSNVYSNENLIDEERASSSNPSDPDVFYPSLTPTSQMDFINELPKSPVSKTREARERGEMPEFSDVKTYFNVKSQKVPRSMSNPNLVQFGVQSNASPPIQVAMKPASRFTPGKSHLNADRPSVLNVPQAMTKIKQVEQNNNVNENSASPAETRTAQSLSPVTADISISKKTKRFKKQKSSAEEKKSQSKEHLILQVSKEGKDGQQADPRKLSVKNGAVTQKDRKLSETLC